jgi:hypothetical protein
MNRLTRNQDKFWGKDNYVGHKYIIDADGITSKQMVIDKLGKLEDLEEELGVNDLITFLKWCITFRKDYTNRTFDDLVGFYKKAIKVGKIEKEKSE